MGIIVGSVEGAPEGFAKDGEGVGASRSMVGTDDGTSDFLLFVLLAPPFPSLPLLFPSLPLPLPSPSPAFLLFEGGIALPPLLETTLMTLVKTGCFLSCRIAPISSADSTEEQPAETTPSKAKVENRMMRGSIQTGDLAINGALFFALPYVFG
jgi:hypothetical protein